MRTKAERKKEERQLERLAERMRIMAAIRNAGGFVNAFNAYGDAVDDMTRGLSLYWKVKLPGCAPVIVRDMEALRRISGLPGRA